MIKVQDGQFWDEEGRSIKLRGINLSGDSKLPKTPDVPSHNISHFWQTDNISFVGRPFPIEQADEHLARITSWGFNVIRFIVTWEAVEHAGPGLFDEEYVEYVLAVLRKCGGHGLLVIMDPHQDVWSRFSGGSGAPYWTYIAAGINPKNFKDTEAALVHNTSGQGEDYPKMIWSTNYDRMAAATMFILFFAGKFYAPKAILNGQNIQDYLQSHFLDSMAFVAKKIRLADLVDTVVVGWESMNEPSMSWLGLTDLSVIPARQHLRKGTCPTPFQAILTASGYSQTVQTWDFGTTGPKQQGTSLVDPQGVSIWFDQGFSDDRYSWHRDEKWQLGTCIWAQHGLWQCGNQSLLKSDFFLRGPDGLNLDDAGFLRQFWMPHFRQFLNAIRAEHSSAIIFCQPPVMMIPPVFNEVDRKDARIVYSPHYYDGLTLMNKTWNTWYNVDVLGVLRGRYLSPVFAVKFGLKAIRNCLKNQLLAIKQEGQENLGNYPCLISEIGIPFDLDHGKAYSDDDYTSQIGAMDANNFALEGANVHFTFWHYSALNTNQWGDFWNGEDLSFFSRSRRPEKEARNICESRSEATRLSEERKLSLLGSRAAAAFVRPAPVRIVGQILAQGFDLKTKIFRLQIKCSSIVTAGKVPTVIFLPRLHFGQPHVEIDEGRVEIDLAGQRVYWWHDQASAGQSVELVVTEESQNLSQATFLC